MIYNEQRVPSGPEMAQLSNGRTKEAGVGLQIVKRLCELLEAFLEIETHPDRGTLFRIRMPTRHGN